MLVALVMLGVTACEQNVTIDTPKSEGLSFYAEIAMTRADLEQGTNENGNVVWNTIWEVGDELTVNDGNATYYFTNSSDDVNKFTCEEKGAVELLGKAVTVELNNGTEVWTLGKKGIKASASVDEFAIDTTVELVAMNSFFRYTYTGEGNVGLSLTYDNQDTVPFGYDYTYYPVDSNKDTEGNVWVAFDVPTDGDSATLSYSINGVKVKETTINLAQGKVYNLGTLTDPSFTVYVTPQPKSSAADWTTVNVYAWNDAWNNAWPGEEITANTTVINGYTYYAYTFPVSANNTSAKIIVNNGTNQTADIELGSLTQDLYVVYSVAMNEVYTEAPAEGSIEEYVAPAVKQMIYMKDDCGWNSDGAHIYAYFWNPATWVKMTDTDGDKIYECELPEGVANVIFVRKNSANDTGDWTGVWNQTSDLVLPTDGSNMFTMSYWSGGTWSTK